jgi:hypothetical protein
MIKILGKKTSEQKKRTERDIDKCATPQIRLRNPKYVCPKQQGCTVCEANLMELKAETDKSTTVVGDVNTPSQH